MTDSYICSFDRVIPILEDFIEFPIPELYYLKQMIDDTCIKIQEIRKLIPDAVLTVNMCSSAYDCAQHLLNIYDIIDDDLMDYCNIQYSKFGTRELGSENLYYSEHELYFYERVMNLLGQYNELSTPEKLIEINEVLKEEYNTALANKIVIDNDLKCAEDYHSQLLSMYDQL